MAKTGLLAVDLQEAFLCHPNLTPNRKSLADTVQALLKWSRNEGVPVFHSHTKVKADGSDAMPHWQLSGRITCRDESDDAKAPEAIAPMANEPIFYKSFYDAFEDRNLDERLRHLGIEKLLVFGVHTHACVRQTVLSAYSRGYEVTIIDGAIASYDPMHAVKTLEWLNGRAANIVGANELMCSSNKERKDSTNISIFNPCKTQQKLFEYTPVSFRDVVVSIDRLSARLARSSKEPPANRDEKLLRLSNLLKSQKTEFTEVLVKDLGKPVRDAEAEFDYGMALLQAATKFCKDRHENNSPELHYKPLGVVAVITPWNNPFALAIGKIAPAIGFGNAVIWKPASAALRVSRLLYDSLVSVGFGEDVALAAGEAEVGRWIVDHSKVRAVTFTGSVAVGREIEHTCAVRSIRFQGEMGSSNAAIVLADADLKHAADDLAEAMFSFAGQRCTAIRRILVDESVMSEFCELLTSALSGIRVGDPAQLETQVGPVINAEARDKLAAAMAAAVAGGARILTQVTLNRDANIDGAWFAPTVLEGVSSEDPIWCEEQFGPLVVLKKCKGIDDGIAQSNKGNFGLLGVVYTLNRAARELFIEESQVGLCSINRARPRFSPDGPFSGWKGSGSGIAEHGRWNREFYTRVKAVYIDQNDAGDVLLR